MLFGTCQDPRLSHRVDFEFALLARPRPSNDLLHESERAKPQRIGSSALHGRRARDMRKPREYRVGPDGRRSMVPRCISAYSSTRKAVSRFRYAPDSLVFTLRRAVPQTAPRRWMSVPHWG